MSPVSPVARNTLSNFLAQGWSLLLAVGTTPYIVRGLGVDAYGVFAGITVFLSYLSFADLGFGWGLVKFVADYHARGDRRAMGGAVATTVAVLGAMGVVVAAAFFCTAPWIVQKGLNIPAELHSSAIVALRLTGVTFAVNMIGGVYGCVLRGLQIFQVANAIQATTATMQILLMVTAIAAGYGLVGVVLASAAASVFSVMALYTASRRSFTFSCSFRPSVAMLRSLGGFSAYTAMSGVATQTLYQVEKVFIGLVMPVSALGFYMVPFNLAFKLTGVATAFGTALFPAMSSLLTLGRSAEALALFQRAQRYLVLLLLPPFAFVLAAAPECLMVWIGADFAERGGGPLRLLAVAFFFHVVSALDATALDAAGRPHVNTALFAFGAGVNLLVAAPLVYSFGVYGAATALLLSMLVLAISLWRTTSIMGLAPALGGRIWTAFARPMSLMVPITLALYVVTPRLRSLPALLLAAGGFAAVAYASLALVGLDAAERRRVQLTMEQLRGSLAPAWLARVPKDV